jgi:16S rRNA (uracil1498-N3)-methyltransferase
MKDCNTITEYYFYAEAIESKEIMLAKEEVAHISKVLRIKPNTRITLTDGLGKIANATINNISSNSIDFYDIEVKNIAPLSYSLQIAIAPTKNISRFEWFIEKATEIGIHTIQPILTEHSERKHIRLDRLEKVALSAMKQSKKAWKPEILPLASFNEVTTEVNNCNKYMAYLGVDSPNLYSVKGNFSHTAVLIGPEGGFTAAEYEIAKANGFQSVSLGKSRLRTETAGIVATQIISMQND